MNYGAAIKFPFQGQHRWANIGCVLVTMLIPVVGPLILLGYGMVVEKHLILNPGSESPKFDFGKFGDYLKWGVAPFVANLILAFSAALLIVPGFFLFFLMMVLFQKQPLIGVAALILAIILEFVVILLMTLMLTPVLLKAGLEQTILGAFDRRFIVDFMRRVGLKAILMNLVLFALGMAATIFIFCPPIIGIYLAIVALAYVQWHLRAQLYLLYISRGGQHLRVSPEMTSPSFPVVQTPQQAAQQFEAQPSQPPQPPQFP